MRRKLTITVSEEVYEGLYKVVGPRHISEFLERLARPLVVLADMDEAYEAMAADADREREAQEWAETAVGDAAEFGGDQDEAG